jgi:2-oxoglutarate ferredoxin oxidoreductase subunit alpha
MSNGQLLEDVRLALNGVRPVEFLGRAGGNVPSHEEVLALVRALARKSPPAVELDEEQMANV